MSADTDLIAAIDERLDKLVTLDIGGRGVEHLYVAARARQGRSLIGAAADALLAVPDGSTIFVTTGSVSRAWISTEIGENDGPAGAAIIIRALAIAKKVHCVLLAEETLLPGMRAILISAGLTVLPYDQAAIACKDGSLAVVSMLPFTTSDEEALAAATSMLEQYKPKLFFSTERVGRAKDGVYYSMRAIDYGMGRARIDLLFDEASRQGIRTVAVGDGGNEIGMGAITQAVNDHVKFGQTIAAVSPADVLVTAACSNWGCNAIAAAIAARRKDPRLMNTPELERQLLNRGVDIGLINSVQNVVDANVDGMHLDTHVALVEMLCAVIKPALA
nr:glutamate cyclase domain-containing protein [uncultured Albidiferax sp.]